MRVVLDSNVVVSALLLSDSVLRQAFDKALDHGEIIISTPVLLELAEVLARDKLKQILNRARPDAVFGGPPQGIRACSHNRTD